MVDSVPLDEINRAREDAAAALAEVDELAELEAEEETLPPGR